MIFCHYGVYAEAKGAGDELIGNCFNKTGLKNYGFRQSNFVCNFSTTGGIR